LHLIILAVIVRLVKMITSQEVRVKTVPEAPIAGSTLRFDRQATFYGQAVDPGFIEGLLKMFLSLTEGERI